MPSLGSLPIRAARLLATGLATLERLASRSGEMAQMEYGFLFNLRNGSLPLGITSASIAWIRAITICSHRKRGCAISSRLRRGNCRRRAGLPWGGCSRPMAARPALLSWSGSMFEYLMPLLVMPTYENTLAGPDLQGGGDAADRIWKERGVPWGISESGYNAVDVQFNYQYRAFGVPGLGLKRGLGEDLVIAPYASVLALMVAPEAACANLQRLAAEGIAGKFGFYEAIDYTPSRLRRGETRAVVRSFMAHHQGMSLLSLAYLLLDRPMQRRFESDPLFQATMLLLQERIPKAQRSSARQLPSCPMCA